MIIHPPMLYLGYVGMTVPFAMAVAALLRGQLGPTWLQPLRNWLLVPTAFLTMGIMLGGGGRTRCWLGRLLGVGPGRERVVPALAHRDRGGALGHRARAQGHAQRRGRWC
jgi:hypothetical protein